MKVVGENALKRLIKLIKEKFDTKANKEHTHDAATTSANGFMTKEDKAKIDSLSTVATTGSYNDLSDKPTIPSVGNGRITIKQGGTTKGTFTVNQSGATAIELDDNDTHYTSKNVVGSSADDTNNTTTALTNGNVYLNSVENGSVTSSHNIKGIGGTTVSTDTSGNIVIKGTTGTSYSTGTEDTAGITKLYSGLGTNTDGTMTQLAIGDALAGKAGSAHTHSDYVKKSGSEVSSLNAITAETSTTSVIIPNATAIASSPFARDFWHDHFAFLRGGTSIINNQVSTDGTTWTDDDSDLTPLFIQKETHGITILSTSQLAHRFTIYGDNIKHSYITWFEIGVSYTRPFSSFEVHIESSSDNSSWSTAHKSIVSGNSVPVFLKQNTHFSSNGYLRFTFTKTTNITTGSVQISCLKAFTSRKGNQGLGIDYEYPYDWDSNMNIYPVTDNKSTLGRSGLKWANVYATKFTGALTGNADTATKWATARNINGMTVDGTANRTNYGTCSTAADTAAKTVDCTGFKLVTGAEITVKFTVTNTAAQPTLNVNNQGAKAIYYRGNIIPPTYLAKDRVYTFRYDGKNYELVGDINTDMNTDTKNTAGSTDTSSKIFLIGATSQAANPQTYSHDTAYVGTDGCLYSGGTKVSVDGHTHTKSQITDFPTSLKNPNGLRVQVNGDGASEVRYDGSAAKTINIKAGSNITITSDSSGNITISSTASAGSVTGDVGTVVYEASSGGLYCDGSTANNSNNSVAIQDSSYKYKRLRFYCQGYFGLVCTDMPLDRECDAYGTGDDRGKRYGGVIFPTAENGNINSTGIGPSNHMYYELKWRVVKEAAGWRVRVVDSGWLGFNAGIASDADYTNNPSTAVAGTDYIQWNQRHNNNYCIYKIVGYKV